MKKYKLHISGTHCASCKILVEDILREQDFVKSAQVNLRKETVDIEIFDNREADEVARELTNKIKPNGYTLSVEKVVEESDNDLLWQAIPIGLVFLALFFMLQRSGILNFGIGGKTTPTTSFIIGLIASVSSCLAIVGGLILSLSAKVEKDDNNISTKKPFVLFHAGRLFGFALLGGILGLIGKAIGINFLFSAILGLVASTVMILLGLNLIGIFKKSMFTLPSNIFSFF